MNDQQHLARLRSHCLKVMARRKWTQRDLARAAKVSETSLSRVMNGVNPQFTKGAKLMAVNPEEGA